MAGTRSSHSADGRWWWDGSRWLPVYTADGQSWFDGQRWAPAPGPHRPPPVGSWPRWLIAALVPWAAFLSLPAAVTMLAASGTGWRYVPHPFLPSIYCLAGLAVFATMLLGLLLGQRWLTRYVPLTAAAGTTVLAAWYVAAMLASGPPAAGPGADTGAGAGLVILGVPTLLLLGALLSLSAATGRLAQRLHRQRPQAYALGRPTS